MIKLTKTQLTELFNSSKTWEEIAQEWSIESGLEVTPRMVQECFKANGFNLRSRTRSKAPWYVMIDDLTTVMPTNSNLTTEVEVSAFEEVA